MSKFMQIIVEPPKRKSYARPEITHELRLETRAGSPPPTPIGAPGGGGNSVVVPPPPKP
jgi:hypothetical protein